MIRCIAGIVLSASALAAQVTCCAGVYGPPLICTSYPWPTSTVAPMPIPYTADEVKIASSARIWGTTNSLTEWYVSTNVLLRQPKWNVATEAVPLTESKACLLAEGAVSCQYPKISGWKIGAMRRTTASWTGPDTNPTLWVYAIEVIPEDEEQAWVFEHSLTNQTTHIILKDGTVVAPRTSHSP